MFSAPLEARHVPNHRRLLDHAVCWPTGGRVQKVQPSLRVVGFGPRFLKDLQATFCQ